MSGDRNTSEKTYDWIVVGGGLTGAAISYELAKVGFSVLLLDQNSSPQGATRYSYGGIAYWAGSSPILRVLCEEGITLHCQLSAELEYDTQFREIDLLLTVDVDRDPASIATSYASFAIAPKVLTADGAQAIEPLLDPTMISGALHFPHAQVLPEAMVQAYQQAFLRLGGTLEIKTVARFSQSNHRITGVVTATGEYAAGNVLVAAGAMSRSLLKASGVTTRLYFTQAELIETPPLDVQLRSIIMPAELQRSILEAKASEAATDTLWDEPGHEIAPAILDAGAIQFRDGRMRLGQTSRALTDLQPQLDAAASEVEIRSAVGRVLPALRDVSGTWHCCPVAFSGDRLPLVGGLSNCAGQPLEGLQVFSGFSNPFAIVPALARRFARHLADTPDEIILQLAPDRFTPPA